MTANELYEALLKQARNVNGELRVKGFTDETQYAELYDIFLDVLSPVFEGNYEYWYRLQATARHRQLLRTSLHYDFRDPQYELPLENQSIRAQLVLLRWYLTRLVFSDYRIKMFEEKGGVI